MPESLTTNPCGNNSRLSASLQTLFGIGSLSGLNDADLLHRFLHVPSGDTKAVSGAEAAFTVLVERHGPMVLGVCQAILGDRHDAEDACQAAFLVLARRAGTIRRGDAVASWLYGVARRIAVRARRDLARRRELERRRLAQTARSEPASAPPAEPWPELYEELDRLPESFRSAVVLCDLEGHSYEQAAGLLGCPIGTVQSRLSRGRERLRGHLERRGITPAVVGIGMRVSSAAHAAALSPQMAAGIARAAVGIMAGQTIAGAAPAAVAALAGAEVRRQIMNRALTTLMMLLVAGLMTTAAIGLSAGGRDDDPRHQPPAAAKKPDAGPVHVRVVDLEGKGAAGIAVEWRIRDQPVRSFTTDADGHVTISRDVFNEQGALAARRGREAFAWGTMGESAPNRPSGAVNDPIVMQLLPIDHRVEGSVVDGAGRPVAGVELRAAFLRHPINGVILFETILRGLLAPAVTDQAGQFAISLPRETNLSLNVAHPRWIGWVSVPIDARVLPPAVLEPAGSIIGRVIDAASGRPVAGAVIGAQLIEHRRRILGGWVEATSDEQGRFRLGGAEPGVYNVLLQRLPGRADATARAVECVRVRAGTDATADLSVIEGRLLRGVAVDRDTGEPVPGIQVGCYGPARPRSGATVESHRADDQGRFTFHVAPGEHYVYLMEGDIGSRLAHRTVDVPEQGEVELVRLMRRNVAEPTAMIGMMKAAVPDAVRKIAAPPLGEPTKAAVTEKAKGVVPSDEPAVGKAARKVEEFTKAFEPAPTKVAEEPKAPAEAPKVRTVIGHVRDSQGRPLAGVQLQAVTDRAGPGFGPPEFDLPTTDREGLFLFPDLPRRPLKITLNRPGYRYQSEDLPADRDEVQWTFGLVPDPETRKQPGPPQDDPIPLELRLRLTFVDLDRRGTDYLADGPGYTGNDLSRLPRGIRKLGETYFRIGEKMIHVQGQTWTAPPQSVKGIEVRARGAVVHFLHAVQYGEDSSELIGAYVIHYADGTNERIPLVCGRNLNDWWSFDGSPRLAPAAKVAWTGSNDSTDPTKGLVLHLFDLAWTNPHPEKEIATLDVLSAGKQPDPFLVALTIMRP
jgi:RNA polymerase sigma factor (sigma-70 family)